LSDIVLSVKNLKKTFSKGALRKKPVNALKGISFEIPAGTVTGFLGANGAGKTTTIKCLLNLAFADEGEFRYFGSTTLTPEAKARIGFLPERPYFYEYLTGREFLRFYGELSGNVKVTDLKERIARLLKRVGLEHAGDRALRSYSKGMLQRIGIAQALINEPAFIILDEPMTGLDPDGRFEVREIIRETASQGTAVFFSSHLLPDAEQLCERLVILKLGELVFQGPMTEILGRFESGYQLTTSSDGKLSTTTVATAEALQIAIDQQRASRAQIVEVKPSRLTLEEAFVKIAMGGRK
jgi:ABC-2 type transport system ATP-binding protein